MQGGFRVILRRALWIDNFEDGTFEDYWSATVSVGDAEVYLQEGRLIKDGNYGLRLEFNLDGTDNATATKTWSSPQIDLSDYDRIYFWIRSDTAGTPDVAIRQDAGWDSNITATNALVVNEWDLNYITLTGTRTLVDGIRFDFDDTEFGEADVVVLIDGVVAVRTDSNHEYDFSNQLEERLVKTLTADLQEKKIPGKGVVSITDRGKLSRRRVLTGAFLLASDVTNFETLMRSGENLFLLTGLNDYHGVVIRVAGRSVGQVAGKPSSFPFSMAFVESLESSL